MKISWWKNILLFIILILCQVWVLNQVHLFNLITPLLYVYFILKLSAGMNRNAVIVWSFFIGFCVDIFNNTLGLNALASTIAGFFRYYLLNLTMSREENAYIPSAKTMNMPGFMRYALFLVLLHHVILFSVEAFSVISYEIVLLKIVGSVTLTLILIYSLESLHFEPLEV